MKQERLTKKVQVRMTDKMWEDISKLAKEYDCDFVFVVRHLVQEALNNKNKQQSE